MKKLFGIACVLFCFLNFSIAAYAETAVDTSAVDAVRGVFRLELLFKSLAG